MGRMRNARERRWAGRLPGLAALALPCLAVPGLGAAAVETVAEAPPALWQAYRGQVLVALVVGVLLLALVGTLLGTMVGRHRRETLLHDSEMRFRAMADNIPQLAWMADTRGSIFWFNRRWYDYTGTTPDLALGWGWRQVHHPDHEDRVVRGFRRSWDTGEPWEDTFPLRGADGSSRWFLSRAQPVRDASGKVQLWFGTNTDITDKLRADEALRDSEDRLAAVVAQMSEGLAIFDGRGRPMLWNPAAMRMHGFDADDTPPDDQTRMRTLFEILDPDTDAPVPPVDWAVPRILRGETVRDLELRLRRSDQGWSRVFSFSGALVRRANGETMVVLVISDVTERRAAEERQNLLMREIDHRAKNALAVVQSVVKLTKADDIDAFKMAVEGRVAALGRTHSLLAQMQWGEVDLETVIRGELAPYARSGGADPLHLSGPPVVLQPQAVQSLGMVVHELATNAAKYGALSVDGGSVHIDWAVADGGRLHLSWRELGGPAAIEPGRQGFGSVLIDSAVTRQLGGQVRFDWRAKGLRVDTVLGAGLAWRAIGRHTPALPPASDTPSHAPMGRWRVLIVEDEALVAACLEDDLRDAGCEPVGPATTVDAALDLARSADPLHAALVDLNLHGRDSTPVADALRARGVPFAFATGYTDAGGQTGGVPVLEKPFSSAQLRRTLRALLEQADGADA